MTAFIGRREFITLLNGVAAAWPLQRTRSSRRCRWWGCSIPQSAGSIPPHFVEAFRGGLAETGYVEGQNVVIEYRWAEDRFDRLPGLADDLVRRKVNVIAAPANNPALAAKAATSAISIIFGVGERPRQAWSRRQPRSAGRQCDRHQFFTVEVVAKK